MFLLTNPTDDMQSIFKSFTLSISEFGKASTLLLG